METHRFGAEISELMNLIINSLYSDKDIFLRELVSNASDSINKMRHIQLSNGLENFDPFINIIPDSENKRIIIQDNGIGMNKEDLVDKLGTIAKSGTKEFIKDLKNKNQMIGQFGVGFYSSYLVAKNVSVYSKKYDSDSVYLWESAVDGGSFTVTPTEDVFATGNHGSVVILDLKEDCEDYLDTSKLKSIIKTHSQFVSHNIYLQVEREIEKEVDEEEVPPTEEGEEKARVENVDDEEEVPPLEEEGEVPPTEEEKASVENVDEEEEKARVENVDDEDEVPPLEDIPKEPKKKIIKEKIKELEKQNVAPIWTKAKEDITEEEYKELYKTSTNSWDSYIAKNHFSIEGRINFTGILFTPESAGFKMFEKNDKLSNIKLYVQKVFITDESEYICPKWLSFIKGLVDSDDLPLNVSREILQKNRNIDTIKKTITKKALEMFEQLAEDEEKYGKFYKEFNNNIKLGIHEDSNSRDKLMKLLRYPTSKSSKLISLQEYCKSMKEDQEGIYYLCGEEAVIKNSPFLEKCEKKGYQVILMTDPIDEYIMQTVTEYQETKFISLSKGGEEVDQLKELRDELQKILSESGFSDLEKVVCSSRLEKTPCVVTSGQFGYSPYMEKIMKMQALNSGTNPMMMMGKKILEINPDHPIIKRLDDNRGEVDEQYKSKVKLLYQGGLIRSGFDISDRNEFVDMLDKLIENN